MIAPPRREPGLAALLRGLAAHDGGALEIVSVQSCLRASATFEGMRHRVTISCTGTSAAARAERLAAALPEMEFALPCHLVADVAVTSAVGATISFEALILDEK